MLQNDMTVENKSRDPNFMLVHMHMQPSIIAPFPGLREKSVRMKRKEKENVAK
jgi:hypothetical protein